MEQQYSVHIEPEATRSGPLLERLDPAIGEATTMMSAMLTELLRRSIRGGVLQLSEELHSYAAEQVEAAVVQQTPALENKAAEVAESTARKAVHIVVTEEIHALEQRTRQSERELAAQIEETARAAQHTTATTARELAAQIEQTARTAQAATHETARELTVQIEQTEKRVVETTQQELTQHVQELMARSRQGAAALETRLKALDGLTTELGRQMQEEQKQRAADHATMLAQAVALGQRLEQEERERQAMLDRMQQGVLSVLEEKAASLRAEVERLNRVNETLAARVVELEKPRGLRWLWLRMFGPLPEEPASGVEEAGRHGPSLTTGK